MSADIRHPFTPWFAVAVSLIYGVTFTATEGFDWAYALAFVYAASWLVTEYELRLVRAEVQS